MRFQLDLLEGRAASVEGVAHEVSASCETHRVPLLVFPWTSLACPLQILADASLWRLAVSAEGRRDSLTEETNIEDPCPSIVSESSGFVRMRC